MTDTSRPARRLAHIDYKWIALSNTTLGILMAALNSSIVLIVRPEAGDPPARGKRVKAPARPVVRAAGAPLVAGMGA